MLTAFQVGMLIDEIPWSLSLPYGVTRGIWRGQDALREVENDFIFWEFEPGGDDGFPKPWPQETALTDEV